MSCILSVIHIRQCLTYSGIVIFNQQCRMRWNLKWTEINVYIYAHIVRERLYSASNDHTMLTRNRKQSTLQSNTNYSENLFKRVSGTGGGACDTDETEESWVTKKPTVIEKETRAGLQIPLPAVSFLEIEVLGGSSFCNDVSAILWDPGFDPNLFKTRSTDVEGCRVIKESVVRRGGHKWARVQVFMLSHIAFIEYV